MTAHVVDFPTKLSAKDETIGMVENLLKRLKSGEIVGIAIAYSTSDGDTGQGFHFGDYDQENGHKTNPHVLNSAVSLLNHSIMQYSLEEDG